MSDEKIAAVLKAVGQAKDKGVTAIKVELEAQFNRRSSGDGYTGVDDCDYCDSDGEIRCSWCNGSGIHECDSDDCGSEDHECTDCNGRGYTDCTEHSSEEEIAESSDWSSDRACFVWLMNKIAEKTGKEFNESLITNSGSGHGFGMRHPARWMEYAEFYNDGSVDSEFTFTLKLTDENVQMLPKILEAFRELGETIRGGEFDVRGAGMHMAFLFSPDCSYPSDYDDYSQREYSSSRRFPRQQLDNFKRAMTQLLPALYFLASTNETSRPLRYRMPVVSVDFVGDRYNSIGGKYSAITYRQGAFEFRIFDTCYKEPEVVLDNFVVMSNCMQYLSDEYKSPGVDKIAYQIRFGTDQNNLLERFYQTESHLDVLTAGLKQIKPSYQTVTDIKRKRKFTVTKKKVANLLKEQEHKAELAYKEYEERFKWQLKYQENYTRGDIIENMIRQMSYEELTALTEQQLEEKLQGELKARLDRLQANKTSQAIYIKNLIDQFKQERFGSYTLNFS